MTTDEKIRDEEIQYDINREATKISVYHLEKLIDMNVLQVEKY